MHGPHGGPLHDAAMWTVEMPLPQSSSILDLTPLTVALLQQEGTIGPAAGGLSRAVCVPIVWHVT